jgi:hypothetical protein
MHTAFPACWGTFLRCKRVALPAIRNKMPKGGDHYQVVKEPVRDTPRQSPVIRTKTEAAGRQVRRTVSTDISLKGGHHDVSHFSFVRRDRLSIHGG